MSTSPKARSGALAVGDAPYLGYGVAIVAASLFAWLGPLSRWAYDAGMEPLPFVAWRAGTGALVLLGVVALLARRGRPVVGLGGLGGLRGGERLGLGMAIATGLVLNLSIFGSFSRVSVAIALIGFYTYPAMVAAVAIALGREPASRPVLAALVLALVGMAVVVSGSLDPTTGVVADPFGIALALLAAASQTVFVTVSHRYARVPTEQAMGLILAGTLAGCVVIGLLAGLGPALLHPVREPSVLPVVIAAGAAGAALPSLLFLVAIRLIGGTKSVILMLLEPVVGVGLAAWLLGERLQPVQLVGALAVLAAALLLQRSHRAPGVRQPGAAPGAGGAVGAHEVAVGRNVSGPTSTG